MVVGAVDGVRPGRAGWTAETHADDACSCTAFANNIIDSPIKARQNDRSGSLFMYQSGARRKRAWEAYRITLKDFYRDQVRCLSDAVGGGADRACNMSPVAETVIVGHAADSIEAVAGSAAEGNMSEIDTAVDDVGVRSGAGARIVDVACLV